MLYANTTRLVFSLMIFMAFSANIFSQNVKTEVKDSELEKFIEVQEMIAETQQNVQPQMIRIIEKNDFEVQRFIALSQAIDTQQEIEASAAEIERFEKTENAINKLQVQANSEIADGIEDIGLTIDRYQEIMMAVQQSPDLQNRLQNLR